ncbi:BPL-N domain-containing protein [Gimesia benthica]|nr:BPL-N domain-containing protein [Gimesia benthica]
MSANNSPAPDETAHLTAGLHILQTGRFDLYPVNPPLVKCLAAQSIALAKPQMYWDTTIIKNKPEYRPEFSLGARFVRLNRTRIRLLFFNARLSCLLFSVIGGLVCWKWSRDLYGPSAGLFALALWSFSPNVLAWSATICPDAAAAALGVSAAYCFWRWLINPDSLGAMIAGIVLGLAQLTKMTLIIFFLLWPVVWITYRFSQAHENSDTNKKPSLPELSAILVVALFVLNLGYGFEGTFTRLSEFSFVSSTLTGEGSFTEGGGNRFRETWLENCPVPIPSNYLRGMDLQRHDFEKGLSSYLLGQWQDKGWWYYYIIASLLKVPLGILVLTLISFLLSLKFSNKTCLKSVSGDSNRPIWIHETVLLIPMISLFILVSSQDGFSRHFRYLLPAFPFLFIWISKTAVPSQNKLQLLRFASLTALGWTVVSSLLVFPHSMSYFNELAGGTEKGNRYLLGSNLDWSQDYYYLQDWYDENLKMHPLYVLSNNTFSRYLLDLEDAGPSPPSRHVKHSLSKDMEPGPIPGWHACSVNQINNQTGEYSYFKNFTPVATVGKTIYIYNISLAEANQVRRTLGVGLLADPSTLHRSSLSSEKYSSTDFPYEFDSNKLPQEQSLPIQIAVLAIDQHDAKEYDNLKKTLDPIPFIVWNFLSTEEIQNGRLADFNVVIVPGGKGARYAEQLEEKGKQAVLDFIKSGGGYIGICAGAYLATDRYEWSLGIINAKTMTGKVESSGDGLINITARGGGKAEIELTPAGKEVFKLTPQLISIRYAGGPILSPAGSYDLPLYSVLARYRSEIWAFEAQRGTMDGSPAVIASNYGSGKVIIFSPHPEVYPETRGLLSDAILWAAKRKPTQ